jgi:trimeric autotransporter adhesin
MKRLLTLLPVLLMLPYWANAQVYEENWPEVNGEISVMLKDPARNVLYIGGTFDWIGYPMPRGAGIDAFSGIVNYNFPALNGKVNCTVPDGNGGWYIGGQFSVVGGQLRKNIAQIDAAGQLTTWAPTVNSDVLDIDFAQNTVFICGYFDNVNGTPRNSLAAIEASTGTLTAWDPKPNNIAEKLLVAGNTVFAVGYFDTVGGQKRNRFAGIDITTGQATAFDAGVTGGSSGIGTMVAKGNTLFVGGSFSNMGGAVRSNVAALDITTGQATGFNKGTNGFVSTLSMFGDTLYVTGLFSQFGGQPRWRGAAVDIVGDTLKKWTVSADNITDVTINSTGTIMYLSGGFTKVNNEERFHLAAVDLDSGKVLVWNPSTSSQVATLALSGNTIYAGGAFAAAGKTRLRKNIAAIDLANGVATSWNPGANNTVNALALKGKLLYAGGKFTNIGGIASRFIAALDLDKEMTTAFRPEPDSFTNNRGITAIALRDSVVYAAGYFDSIGGQARRFIAALDSATGKATPWNANADSIVKVLKMDNNLLYAGGLFTSIGGAQRTGLAALDTGTAVATAWNPSPVLGNQGILAIGFNPHGAYVAGDFTDIGGKQQGAIALVDATGALVNWVPQINGASVNALTLSDDYLFLGGNFSTTATPSISKLAALNALTGNCTTWDPLYPAIGSNAAINALELDTARVYIGGKFTDIGPVKRRNFAVYKLEVPVTITDENKPDALSLKLPDYSLHLSITPNPATGKFYCNFTSTHQQTLLLIITDITGRTLHTRTIYATEGDNSIEVQLQCNKQMLIVSLQGEGLRYTVQKVVME